MKLFKVFSKYPTYILIGGCVTLITILLRSLIGKLINDDTSAKYMSSIILAYIIGISLSLFAHQSITFKARDGISIAKKLQFIAIQILGMVLTLICANNLRENILDNWLPTELSKMFAFAVPAFGVSIITYLIKKYIIFERS